MNALARLAGACALAVLFAFSTRSGRTASRLGAAAPPPASAYAPAVFGPNGPRTAGAECFERIAYGRSAEGEVVRCEISYPCVTARQALRSYGSVEACPIAVGPAGIDVVDARGTRVPVLSTARSAPLVVPTGDASQDAAVRQLFGLLHLATRGWAQDQRQWALTVDPARRKLVGDRWAQCYAFRTDELDDPTYHRHACSRRPGGPHRCRESSGARGEITVAEHVGFLEFWEERSSRRRCAPCADGCDARDLGASHTRWFGSALVP